MNEEATALYEKAYKEGLTMEERTRFRELTTVRPTRSEFYLGIREDIKWLSTLYTAFLGTLPAHAIMEHAGAPYEATEVMVKIKKGFEALYEKLGG